MSRRSFVCAIGLTITHVALAADVSVSLDLSVAQPQRQHSILAQPGSGTVQASVTIFDPSASHAVFSIGYLGGLDRGISCGHMIGAANHGTITRFSATVDTPVNPGNQGYTINAYPGIKAFDGPEVHYLEWGADQAATIAAVPRPVFTLQIEYTDALPCDTFDFYLVDYVTIWRGFPPGFPPAGAFSTTGLNSLDTGGDALADQTHTVHGFDPDRGVPVPPGAFVVDYVDGPPGGGPATIRISWPGDLDGDRLVGLGDLTILLAHFGMEPGATYADGDINGDGAVAMEDLTTLLAFFGNGCAN